MIFDDGCGIAIPGDWKKDAPSGIRLDLEPSTSRNFPRKAKDVGEKFKHFFCKRRKRTMAIESSTSRRLKESKKNIFYRKQKNAFCNIKRFKKLLTSVQKIDI